MLYVNGIEENEGEVKFIKDKVEISKNGNIILESKKNNKGNRFKGSKLSLGLKTEKSNFVAQKTWTLK